MNTYYMNTNLITIFIYDNIICCAHAHYIRAYSHTI